MARDPRTKGLKTVMLRGKPVVYYLCPELGAE
jgi:hypothetical protein